MACDSVGGCVMVSEDAAGSSHHPTATQPPTTNRTRRVLLSCLLYLELFCCCVDFLILEGDGLSALFPEFTLTVGTIHFTAHQVGWLLVDK
jgi:hypothetical protein